MAVRTLDHADYTVGWICALSCEATAARAMFDEEHGPLKQSANDRNVYSLGAIHGFNVVVAVLPEGSYGLRSTTTVAEHMLATFGSISLHLLVGIGGGVPTNDIRLGDVVVSVPRNGRPAILQHDFGKKNATGLFEYTGRLNRPAGQLLSAVSSLQARQELHGSQMSNSIHAALSKFGLASKGYLYPGVHQDVLYDQDCTHSIEDAECTVCTPRVVFRPPRPDVDPRIHLGCIASGNSVIKNARYRDEVAKEHNILCFEMEAAGLPDTFPALVVRGICDYCDSHKHKSWQKYAALAAAAYVKELLEILPWRPTRASMSSTQMTKFEELTSETVKTLDFQDSVTRLMTIDDAHAQTLRWLSSHKTYLAWQDPLQMISHRGLIWIKAKPGAGKSTLMKFALAQFDPSASVSFFFSARGTTLQKTTIGMYRSLLFQLFTKYPELRPALNRANVPRMLHDIAILKDVFRVAIYKLSRPLTCFVDALDESPEDDIRDLIEYLEQVMEYSAPLGFLRVCCSSRYYPHISTQTGLELLLDKETEHEQDIARYIDSRLLIGNSDESKRIKADMVRKSAGVFLWVVLVTRAMKKEFDHGRLRALRKKLDSTPSGLNALFHDMLMRDNDNLRGLVACIRWVLYAWRPLIATEFYLAILASDTDYRYDYEEIFDSLSSPEVLARFITSTSKGLLEVSDPTSSIRPHTVQVIHESVREYLQSGELSNISPDFRAVMPGPSHAHLAEVCFNHIRQVIRAGTKSMEHSQRILRYATSSLLYHAEAALQNGGDTSSFLHSLFSESLQDLLLKIGGTGSYGYADVNGHSGFIDPQILREVDKRLRWRSFLARFGYHMLFQQYELQHGQDYSALSGVKSQDLCVAARKGFVKIFVLLLQPAPGHGVTSEQFDIAVRLFCQGANGLEKDRENFFPDGFCGPDATALAKVLLKCKPWVSCQDPLSIFKLARSHGELHSFSRYYITRELSTIQKQEYLRIAIDQADIDMVRHCWSVGADVSAMESNSISDDAIKTRDLALCEMSLDITHINDPLPSRKQILRRLASLNDHAAIMDLVLSADERREDR